MGNRADLHQILKTILGSSNVYYQPPTTLKMSYPAIRYSLYDIDMLKADDTLYNSMKCYQIILIDKNPDSTYVNAIAALEYCSFDRFYTADNLNHFVFRLYY